MNKSIILLSGGLDSLVSLGFSKEKYNISLALTFDYGQKSAEYEIEASKNICAYYKINHKVIKLDWLKEITHTSLVSDDEIPTGDALKDGIESMKNVWVPNRNGLFLNIAGAFADGEGYSHIFIGANKEEAGTFSDNTIDFINAINKEFEFSTQNKVKVVAPLINSDKNEIVKIALDNDIPLELTRSCYKNSLKHCGQCESCTRLKNALLNNNAQKYLKMLF
ncbi:7-cyano-7-deazaguanine synthase QueC [bacterium]|nr:7-cyano-7-deazaguanine synthase QueC [bacterium]